MHLKPISKSRQTAFGGGIHIVAAGLKFSKTGVTFSPSRPIPDDLIEKLAIASLRDHVGFGQ